MAVTCEEDPDFTGKALRLIGDDGILGIQMYLIGQPDASDMVPGSGFGAACMLISIALRYPEVIQEEVA